MPRKIPSSEPRTFKQLEEHYLIEKELADRLRKASKSERGSLYADLYDELYRLVPLHPQLTRKADPKAQAAEVSERMSLLRPFLSSGCTFLEVGPGDCALALEVAKFAKRVYAVDVSKRIIQGERASENFELLVSDGCSVPVPRNSIDVAYSNQLMEHLHPDDALEQLQNIYNALTVGGIYICITPNRLFGPHDISKYFDDVATGFHLKEYTTRELLNLFEMAGFGKILLVIQARNCYQLLQASSFQRIEDLLAKLSAPVIRRLSQQKLLSSLLDTKLVATKTD